MTVYALSRFLNTEPKELLPAIRRLSETKRLLCYYATVESDLSENMPEYTEISQNIKSQADLSHQRRGEENRGEENRKQIDVNEAINQIVEKLTDNGKSKKT